MKITEFHTQLDDFWKPMRSKYGLRNFSFDPAHQSSEPCIFFGFYFNRELTRMLEQRTGIIVVIWAGSDSMRGNKDYGALSYFHQHKDRVFHIAYSHWIKTDLDAMGLKYFEIPIFPVEFSKEQFKVKPLGDCVYHYTNPSGSRQPFYGTDTVQEIKKRVGDSHVLSNKFIITTYSSYDRSKLHEVYEKCFVGVRLTPHDNMAISCVEMALMGRRSIFNGNIPGAIPFKDRSEVFGLIMEEWEYDQPDRLVAQEMWDFINLDKGQWLDTNFYK